MPRLLALYFCMIFFMFNTHSFAQYRCDFETEMPSEAFSFPSGCFESSSSNAISGKQSLSHVFDSQLNGLSYFTAMFPEINLLQNEVTWQFRLKHVYAPSSSNNWAFILTSDKSADQFSKAKGLAIGVNANNSTDKLQVYTFENGKFSTAFETSYNWETQIGISAAPLLQVVRKANGDCTVSISVDGLTENLQVIGNGNVAIPSACYYWGLAYTFTKEQDRKIWLDDIVINWNTDNPPTSTINRYDVVFSELMPDPEPVVSLPVYEYAELHNRSANEIDLTNWKITINKNSYPLPACKLKPYSNLLFSTTEGANALSIYGQAIGLFRSKTTLSNEGATLALYNAQGQIIDAVSYSANDLKNSEGGRSLLSRKVLYPCLTSNYWYLCTNEQGGNPGLCDDHPSASPLALSPFKTFVEGKKTLHLSYNQSIDSSKAVNISNYTILNELYSIASISVKPPFFQEVIINLNEELEEGKTLELSTINPICNCDSSNEASLTQVKFALAQQAQKGDVILSEIRFEPLPGLPEFIEIQNISNKVIDVCNLQLHTQSTTSSKVTSVNFPTSQLLFPDEYIAFYTGNDSLSCAPNNHVQPWLSMPNLVSDEGYIELCDTLGQVFENVHYSEDWQFSLLNEKRGHSLERISRTSDANKAESWQSSANPCGTPGLPNSQQLTNNNSAQLSFSSETFGLKAGLEPSIEIQLLNLPIGGMLSIQLYDVSGKLVKNLVRNELAGNNYSINYNGSDDHNTLLNNGMYIVYARCVFPEGKIIERKKICTWIKD